MSRGVRGLASALASSLVLGLASSWVFVLASGFGCELVASSALQWPWASLSVFVSAQPSELG